jgi:hypothetical protein
MQGLRSDNDLRSYGQNLGREDDPESTSPLLARVVDVDSRQVAGRVESMVTVAPEPL